MWDVEEVRINQTTQYYKGMSLSQYLSVKWNFNQLCQKMIVGTLQVDSKA